MNDDDIYLKKVHLASDVYSLCVQHALTTEKQEIMGLLIGDVNFCTAYIFLFLLYCFRWTTRNVSPTSQHLSSCTGMTSSQTVWKSPRNSSIPLPCTLNSWLLS